MHSSLSPLLQSLAPKVGTIVNLSRVFVPSKEQRSLLVAIRIRPILKNEAAKDPRKDIIRVLDNKVVVVLDPDETKDYLDQVQNRTKEKRYTFDVAFDGNASNEDVYRGTIADLVGDALSGLNVTVFAYGATGSGKTYSMVGTSGDPGLMVLSLRKIFQDREALYSQEDLEVSCSYLEVYNEVIYDLLVKNSGPLDLREDPTSGVQVAGLSHITVTSAQQILGLLEEGNRRRKVDSTDANATSSRSHAVFEIVVKRTPNGNHYRTQPLIGRLSLVDLAGSERAAETNNLGQKLRDGANINKSLLALANCINALGKKQKSGVVYVPYRNSKLTRLLKDGLCGNSKTAMIATVSAASDQYHHTINTLKYADRAKEIKTHVARNVGSVERHVADYQKIIDNLQGEVQGLKAQLQEKQHVDPSMLGRPVSIDDSSLAMIDSLAQEMNDNIEERINLQKALFELEDLNVCNMYEKKNLEDVLDQGQMSPRSHTDIMERLQEISDQLRENQQSTEQYKGDIRANDEERLRIQEKIESVSELSHNPSLMKMMRTFRMQAIKYSELKFQMAIRDQVISEQRDVIANLWKILEASGLDHEKVMAIARQEGIFLEGTMQDEEAASDAGTSTRLVAGNPAARRITNADGERSSLVGGRAKARYTFWSKYSSRDGAVEDLSSQIPPPRFSAAAVPLPRQDNSPSRIPAPASRAPSRRGVTPPPAGRPRVPVKPHAPRTNHDVHASPRGGPVRSSRVSRAPTPSRGGPPAKGPKHEKNPGLPFPEGDPPLSKVAPSLPLIKKKHPLLAPAPGRDKKGG